MCAEKRAFLEAVMKDGIVDPAQEMKLILAKLTDALQAMCPSSSVDTTNTPATSEEETHEEEKDSEKTLDNDGMVNALEELSDIVEQIDYARDFVKMNGLPFLLGCASQVDVPANIRQGCLGVLATVCQNNPPVQQALLELDALSVLTGLYLTEVNRDEDGKMRNKIVQVLSCMVRGHAVGEESFCRSEHCRLIIENGLGGAIVASSASDSEQSEAHSYSPPTVLKRRCVFFLRALLCSDFSSRKRVRDFDPSIIRVINFLDVNVEDNFDIREMSINLILQIMEQKHSVNRIMMERDRIVSIGVQRVASLRALPDGEEREMYQEELGMWESLITELAKATRDEENEEASAPLMIAGRPPDDSGTTLAQ